MLRGAMRWAVVLVLGALVLPTGYAMAATGHVYSWQFGGPGSDAGQVTSPAGIAVSPSGGAVYVVDQGSAAVQAFDASGDPLMRFDGAATPAGAFSIPTAVAVDSAGGDVLVADSGNNVVDRFDASGAYQSQLVGGDTPAGGFSSPSGVAVDGTSATPTSGFVYVADSNNNVVDVFDASGTYVRQITGTDSIAFSFPTSLAIDAAGNLYVVDAGNGQVAEFAPGGTSFTRVVDSGRSPQAVAVDDSTGDVYVVDADPDGVPFVVGFDAAEGFNEFGLGRISYTSALAVSPTSHAVYVADQGNGLIERFRATTLAAVHTGAASSVGAATADVAGTVNPLGAPATYRFDYGLDQSYGNSTTDAAAGSGSASAPVGASLAGLQPNATYHYRVTATSAGGAEHGADQTFTTDAAVPSVGAQAATSVTPSSATLTAQVNPNNSDTTYHFEIGADTSYALGSTPTPDAGLGTGFGEQQAAADLAGGGITLQPDTTYHFRVVATNGAGAPVTGSDTTFTTLPRAPVVVTGDASAVTPSSATISGTVDPGGSGPRSQTTYFFQYGTDTTYGVGRAPASAADGGTGTGAVAHSAELAELKPNTTYHYRIVAANEGGTVTGNDRTFTTVAAPPVAMTGAAAEVTATTATLTGTVDPRGLATTYTFELGIDGGYGTSVFGSAGHGSGDQAVTLRLRVLAPGTTYHFRLTATNADGSVAGVDRVFTTPGFSTSLVSPVTPLLRAPYAPPDDAGTAPPATKKPTTHNKKPATHKKKPATHKKQSKKTSKKKSKMQHKKPARKHASKPTKRHTSTKHHQKGTK
jgi:DNA-binding beta-propeller fold protein YncE